MINILKVGNIMDNIVESAKKRWNSQADCFNQWDNLGLVEILELVAEEEKIIYNNSRNKHCPVCGGPMFKTNYCIDGYCATYKEQNDCQMPIGNIEFQEYCTINHIPNSY